MDTKNITIGVFVATTLVFGVLFVKKPSIVTEYKSLGASSAPVVNVPAPVVNVSVPAQPTPVVNVNVPRQTSSPVLGSVSSPDIQSPYFSFGGVRHWGARTETLTSATTTICALQSPPATSTLEFASIQLTTSSTTASTVTIAKATTAFATTTLLGNGSISANAQGTIVASTTNSVNPSGLGVFSPNTYLVVGMAGGIGTFSPVGSCIATWVQN